MMFMTIAADAAESGLIDGYLFENPWPLGLLLLFCGIVIGGLAFRDGNTNRLPVAGLFMLLGGAVIATGLLVTTAGEHAMHVARDLVLAVEGNDLTGAERLLADSMTYGATDLTNLPMGGKADIMAALADFTARVSLESNRITNMDIATIDGDEGRVHLSLWTEATSSGSAASAGGMPMVGRSSWILVVRRDPGGVWRIHRIIWVELNGRTPPMNRF